mgnify:CR=1 FL=1
MLIKPFKFLSLQAQFRNALEKMGHLRMDLISSLSVLSLEVELREPHVRKTYLQPYLVEMGVLFMGGLGSTVHGMSRVV